MKKTEGSDTIVTSLHTVQQSLDQFLKNAGAGFSITSGTFSSSTRNTHPEESSMMPTDVRRNEPVLVCFGSLFHDFSTYLGHCKYRRFSVLGYFLLDW